MKKVFFLFALLCLTCSAWAQQDYVGRYVAFAGYTYLDTPKMNLMERGFITQDGINLNRWLALGVDFSALTGKSDLKIGELVANDRTTAHGVGLPDTFGVHYNSTTYTLTAGPQFNLRTRKLPRATFLLHPSVGAIRETVKGAPLNATQKVVMAAFVPGGERTDTTIFYGVGGGVQYQLTPHLGMRFTVDVVRVHLFDFLLADARVSTRFGIGPTYTFGSNVAKHR